MSEEKFYAKPWKCALPGCDDPQIHRHTPTAWVTELATANKKIEDQGIIQNAIIADLRGQLDTIRASSASQGKVVEGLADKIDMIRDFECCDVSSKFCGWKESITEVVSAFDAALAGLTPGKEVKP